MGQFECYLCECFVRDKQSCVSKFCQKNFSERSMFLTFSLDWFVFLWHCYRSHFKSACDVVLSTTENDVCETNRGNTNRNSLPGKALPITWNFTILRNTKLLTHRNNNGEYDNSSENYLLILLPSRKYFPKCDEK